MASHSSDCSLHNFPAYWPEPCDCGVTRPGSPASIIEYIRYQYHAAREGAPFGETLTKATLKAG